MSKSMRRKMAGVLSTVVIAGSMPVVANVTDTNSNLETTYIKEVATERTTSGGTEAGDQHEKASVKVLDFSEVEAGDYSKDFTVGDFTVKIKEGEKVLTVDENEQTSEYYHTLAKRIKLGGKGTAEYRSIHFETSGPATIQLYAFSTSNGTARDLEVFDADGKSQGTVTVLGEGDLTGDKKMPVKTITVDKAGKYYIMPKANINLYYMSVTEGTPEEITFEDGTTPEIVEAKQNAEDGNRIDVTVKGQIADAKTDKLWIKMYDADDKLVASQKVSELENDLAKVQFSPSQNGTYKFVCEAIREGATRGYSSNESMLDVVLPLGDVKFENVKTGKDNTLNVDWNDVRNATSYEISLVGEDGKEEVVKDLKESKYVFKNLTPGVRYTLTLIATDGNGVKKATCEKVLAQKEERFLAAEVGSGASGYITENTDGSITMAAVPVGSGSGGKLADSEDGFLYYYTEINPETENFTLTATFHVDDSASKDNQSGFGVMAIDTFEAGSSSARYFNSAGAMLRKYSRTVDGAVSSIMGAPGGYFVTGYTGKPTTSSSSRKNIDTAPFDWDYKDDYVIYNPDGTIKNSNPPRFEDGEEYTLTLRKSNTGFHASMIDPRTGEKTEEVICYEPDLLLQQDKDKYYVGVAVSRKITVTVKDINFTTIAPEDDEAKQERPVSYIKPSFNFNGSTTSGSANYEAGFKADFAGKIDVLDSNGNVVAKDITVDPRNAETVRAVADLKLTKGTNTYTAIYTPLAKEGQGELLGQYEELTSYEPMEIKFTVDHRNYGTEANAIYVSPTATAEGKGTKASPLDIYTAVNYAQPGQEIVLLGGTYKMSKGITVNRGNNGTAEKPIVLMSDPSERAVLDFTGCSDIGITLGGDYWHIYDMEVMNSGKQGVQVTGNHNTVEKLTVHGSGNTGIQISGSATEPKEMWPSYNLIQSCESYDNCDALANDADGFAAKLTVGDGNIFRYCIAHHNIDDGWDLYAKSTTGVIGEVIVEKSVVYANGRLTTGGIIGEGNGFKLGGESMPVAHILRDSISFDNLKNGVFSNSNPSCKVSNVISFNNGSESEGGKNLYFNTNASTTTWELDNFISYKGYESDATDLKNQDSLESTTNYLNGVNSKGDKVEDSWFESLESVVPTIAADGSIDMGDFLKLTSNAPAGVGTIFGPNPNPTVIQIGGEISTGSTGSTGGSSSSSSKPTTVVTTGDAQKQNIEAAIKNNKVPTIAVDKNNQVALNKESVESLLTNKSDVIFTANGTSLTMNNILLNSIVNKEAVAMKVQVAPTSEANYKKLQDTLKLMGDQKTTMEITVNTDKAVTSFTEPAKVSFDLSNVTELNPSKLTLVRYEIAEDGTVTTVKLGGSYDEKTKTFTGRVDQTGNYAVVEANELLKINMTIGDKTSVVNDSNINNDIAPQIINGSTMVPVRFIAENLGAEVKWDGKKKQVNINLNGEVVTVNSNDGMLIKDSRTLVPIRYVSENLGANVLWVGSSKEIEIVK